MSRRAWGYMVGVGAQVPRATNAPPVITPIVRPGQPAWYGSTQTGVFLASNFQEPNRFASAGPFILPPAYVAPASPPGPTVSHGYMWLPEPSKQHPFGGPGGWLFPAGAYACAFWYAGIEYGVAAMISTDDHRHVTTGGMTMLGLWNNVPLEYISSTIAPYEVVR